MGLNYKSSSCLLRCQIIRQVDGKNPVNGIATFSYVSAYSGNLDIPLMV